MPRETEAPGRWIPITPIAPRRCHPLTPMAPVWVPERAPVPATPNTQPEPDKQKEPDLIPA